MKVAIVGGTGAFGRALAKRLQELGQDEVVVGPGDALICGDDERAKELALELAGRLADRAIDVGPLGNSRALEGMTAVILNVNKRYKAHAGIRLTGLP